MKKHQHAIGAVACCGECGTPVQVVCPKGHDPEPLSFEETPAKPGRSKSSTSNDVENVETAAPKAPRAPVSYREKTCACGATFTPKGPNQRKCSPTCTGLAL